MQRRRRSDLGLRTQITVIHLHEHHQEGGRRFWQDHEGQNDFLNLNHPAIHDPAITNAWLGRKPVGRGYSPIASLCAAFVSQLQPAPVSSTIQAVADTRPIAHFVFSADLTSVLVARHRDHHASK